MRTTPIPEKELNDAKRAIVASFALSLEKPEQVLGYYVQNWLYSLPADYWDTYPAKISADHGGAGAGGGDEVLGPREAADRRGRRRGEDHGHPEEARDGRDLRRGRQAGEGVLKGSGFRLWASALSSEGFPEPGAQSLSAAISSIAAAKVSISSSVV